MLRALPVAIAIVISAGLGLASCGGADEPRALKLVIQPEPPGSRPATTPATSATKIDARVGDRLVVTNRDKYLHIVAEHPVRAGQTRTIVLTRPGTFKTGCSVHRERQTTVVVAKR